MNIKPCPFCGESEEIFAVKLASHKIFKFPVYTECYTCGTKTAAMPGVKDAFKRWNKRSTQETQAVWGERFECKHKEKVDQSLPNLCDEDDHIWVRRRYCSECGVRELMGGGRGID